jgi:hypothetical protein
MTWSALKNLRTSPKSRKVHTLNQSNEASSASLLIQKIISSWKIIVDLALPTHLEYRSSLEDSPKISQLF